MNVWDIPWNYWVGFCAFADEYAKKMREGNS